MAPVPPVALKVIDPLFVQQSGLVTFAVNTIGEGIEIVNFLTSSTGIKLNCGVGNGINARSAAEMATKSLDSIRAYRKSGKIINVFESN